MTSPPPHGRPVTESLGLPAPTAAEHTRVFVLAAPPHAAIYLGQDGMLGGEGLDRVAGFWRAIGLAPPQDADHLGLLLMLYAELGEAEAEARSGTTRDRVRHARQALLFEHLWSWAPGYLTAVTRLGTPSLAAWARLTLARSRPGSTPRGGATRPPAGTARGPRTASGAPGNRGQLLDALIAPARSGVLLTREDLREAAAVAGLGFRVGERRYTLASDARPGRGAAVGWLAEHARRWAALHAAQQPRRTRSPALVGAARGTHRPYSATAANPARHGWLKSVYAAQSSAAGTDGVGDGLRP